jgi:hypothetical protein
LALEVLTSEQAVEFVNNDASGQYTDAERDILNEISARRTRTRTEQVEFQAQCDRWDSMYYPETFTSGGVSHWAGHSSAWTPGKSHVSVNSPPLYVDIPAALQSVPPNENVISTDETDKDASDQAVLGERLYYSWKDEEDYEFKGHRACVVKGLYGRTASKIWWDAKENKVRFDVVDQPRNLWLGWSQSDYRTLDWAMYSYLVTPEFALSEWGLVTTEAVGADGKSYPYLMPVGSFGTFDYARRAMWTMGGSIEVIDYWYRLPKKGAMPEDGKIGAVEHETWNAIVVGNRVVKNMPHSEYDGAMPYVPLFNTFVPGVPTGRPELFDIEQLIREKDERMTSGSQLMHNIVNAQYWQLTGPESPDQVPVGLRPKANQVVAPGAGNRIEGILPWMPEFQLEQFLSRVDREMIDVSGLNDLLRGMAPEAVMSSSKAVSALVANYETRIRMKRDIYYRWRKSNWNLIVTIWAKKDSSIADVLKASRRIKIDPPTLTPRDDMEASQIAANLMNSKIWSQRRAMDRTGVDDPEAEQDDIREERTDATMFPAEVQVLAQLLATLKNMGYGAQPQVQQQADQAAGSMNDLRALGGGMNGVPSMNGQGEGPLTPPEQLVPGASPPIDGGQPVGPGGPDGVPLEAPGSKFLSQTQVVGGKAKNRLLSQVPLGTPPGPAPGG